MATDDVFDRCVSHYFRTRRQNLGEQPGIVVIPQPSRSASGWQSKEVFALRNCNGVLARYSIKGDEKLRVRIRRMAD